MHVTRCHVAFLLLRGLPCIGCSHIFVICVQQDTTETIYISYCDVVALAMILPTAKLERYDTAGTRLTVAIVPAVKFTALVCDRVSPVDLRVLVVLLAALFDISICVCS